MSSLEVCACMLCFVCGVYVFKIIHLCAGGECVRLCACTHAYVNFICGLFIYACVLMHACASVRNSYMSFIINKDNTLGLLNCALIVKCTCCSVGVDYKRTNIRLQVVCW